MVCVQKWQPNGEFVTTTTIRIAASLATVVSCHFRRRDRRNLNFKPSWEAARLHAPLSDEAHLSSLTDVDALGPKRAQKRPQAPEPKDRGQGALIANNYRSGSPRIV
jgi:hypothetical protein